MIIIYNLTQSSFSERRADRLHKKLFSRFNIKSHHILELILVNKKIIKRLNRQYLHRNQETDVISFPIDNSHIDNKKFSTIFGSICLCPEYIQQEDKKNDNYDSYIIHGFIHLLGYDHYTENDKKRWSQVLKEIKKL